MKLNKKFLLSAVITMVITSQAIAQAKFEFSLQSWGSYTSYDHAADTADAYYEFDETTGNAVLVPAEITPAYSSTQFGFGIRRARLRGKMSHGKAAAFVQFEAAGSPTLLDARLDYSLSDNLKLRMGRFIGAGSQAGGRTGHTSIDFIERSIVGRNWGAALSRSDYRTYGIGLLGKMNQFKYEITMNNGANTINLKPYNVKSGGSATDTGLLPQIDLMGEMAVSNGINIGASYGLANEDRINRSSATGFVYYKPEDYGSGDVRSKFDLAMVNDVDGDYGMFGYSVLGAMRMTDKIEVGGRYESWDPNNDVEEDAVSNITIGINFAPNPDKWMDTLFKFDLTYKMAQDSDGVPDPVIAHFMWQMYLH